MIHFYTWISTSIRELRPVHSRGKILGKEPDGAKHNIHQNFLQITAHFDHYMFFC